MAIGGSALLQQQIAARISTGEPLEIRYGRDMKVLADGLKRSVEANFGEAIPKVNIQPDDTIKNLAIVLPGNTIEGQLGELAGLLRSAIGIARRPSP